MGIFKAHMRRARVALATLVLLSTQLVAAAPLCSAIMVDAMHAGRAEGVAHFVTVTATEPCCDESPMQTPDCAVAFASPSPAAASGMAPGSLDSAAPPPQVATVAYSGASPAVASLVVASRAAYALPAYILFGRFLS